MSPTNPKETFSYILAGVGTHKDFTPNMIKFGWMRVRQSDNLPDLQRAQLLQNLTPDPISVPKPVLEHRTFKMISGKRVVQTKTNPEDINPVYVSRAYAGKLCPYSKLVWPVDAEGRKTRKWPRPIPHFDRLFANTEMYLPRFVFRVVHAESAGKVFIDEFGITHFWSHAYMENDGPSNFETFKCADIRRQLRGHVHSFKSMDGKPFASHWISTTDSFECAVYRAHRHITEGKRDVTIYVIDTHSLQNSAIAFLMALALRAWNVLEVTLRWRVYFFMYGALTEWVLWDNIVASKVEKISYVGTASVSQRHNSQNQLMGLERLIPAVVEASKHEAHDEQGVSRAVLHACIYTSTEHERERQVFSAQIMATRNGPLPLAPKSVQNDRRAQIDDKTLGDVWNSVKALANRNLLFIWLLSLVTQTYYADSIAERVVVRYPEVIEESLELITSDPNTDGVYESILTCYMSGRGCVGRVDVNEYQSMMLACVTEWHLRVQTDKNHRYYGTKVYIVAGQGRPTRNLLRVRELGFMGRCKTEALRHGFETTSISLSFKEVVKQGRLLRLPETDEEHHLRLQKEHNNVFCVPDGIPLVITKRVYEDQSHHSAEYQPRC